MLHLPRISATDKQTPGFKQLKQMSGKSSTYHMLSLSCENVNKVAVHYYSEEKNTLQLIAAGQSIKHLYKPDLKKKLRNTAENFIHLTCIVP